jgi:SAM-dependent methyltransferase
MISTALLAPSSASIERLVPQQLDAGDVTGQQTLELHMQRYRFAAQFVGDGPVLDCACGVGYGSAYLAEASGSAVTGVDIDQAAVSHAREHYRGERLEFMCSEATAFHGGPYATIVTLETIEHVPDPGALVSHFRSLLRPGGIIVASVPVTPSKDVNPYHLHDFTPASYRALFTSRGFRERADLPQVQPYQPLRILGGQEKRMADMRSNLLGYYATHPVAALTRLRTTIVDGFCNKYLTCAWELQA